MKRFLLNFLITILTFALGIGIYRVSTPNVSLKTISDYTFFYDGTNVEIETYIQATGYDTDTLLLGDFSNRSGIAAYIYPSELTVNLSSLQNQLIGNFTETRFKRMKVLVKGTVKDNCKTDYGSGKISFGCCFGRSVTIKAQEVTQLEPVKDYIKPE